MIPFFQINYFLLGTIEIQVWGLFVSSGILAGIILSYYLARKYFLAVNLMTDMGIWAILGGLIGARLFYILFYAPDHYWQYPADIFKFWQGGSSSMGGFFGGITALYLFAKIKNISWSEFLPYFDVGIVGLWLGWAIGRLGCFFIHDHPGRLTNFFLAVNFPGGARFDLGLLESILSLTIFVICFLFFEKLTKIRRGLVAVFSVYLYASARFLLDFLRAVDLEYSDPRYYHLTPSQWGMVAVVVLLTSGLIYSRIRQKYE